jgi:hypothetical protein
LRWLRLEPIDGPVRPIGSVAPVAAVVASPLTAANKSQLLLEALKEELFAIEMEKVSGKLAMEEYLEVKAALEIVLRRALGRQ